MSFGQQYFSAKSICQHGISNLSDLIMATIKYEIDGESTEKHMNIIIKLLPQDPFGRYFVTINQFDLREIKFYTKVNKNQPILFRIDKRFSFTFIFFLFSIIFFFLIEFRFSRT